MDPQSMVHLHPHPGHGPPPHPPHPPMPDLPPNAAPGDLDGRDPVGWWEIIGGTWRWITNPNA